MIELAKDAYGTGSVRFGNGSEGPHEAGWLALEVAKARNALNIQPRWTLAEAVARTMHWYREQAAGADARQLCETDIDNYETSA